MRPPAVRPYRPTDLAACAALLAASHARMRRLQPVLPERFESTEGAKSALETVLEGALKGGPDCWVAQRDGRVVGYLFGTRSLPAPDSFGAQYGAPRSATVSVAGHALAEGEPAEEAYRALYGAAAAPWADDGFFSHHVSVRPFDLEAREAWFLLGFGAHTTFCSRPAEPVDSAVDSVVDSAAAPGIQVHAATPEELSVVRHFDELEALHHRESPIFWPFLTRDVASAVEAFQRAALEGDQNRIFIATRGGEPVGMHFMLRPGFGNPVSQPDDSTYLYQAIVEPSVQGGGIGATLLRHSVEWAREQGAPWVNLHYAAMNPSGAPFWRRHGFVPLEMSLRRSLDERIAWARGR